MKEFVFVVLILITLNALCMSTRLTDFGQAVAASALGVVVYFSTSFKFFIFACICYSAVYVFRFVLKFSKKSVYSALYGDKPRNGWHFLSLVGIAFPLAFLLSFVKKPLPEIDYKFGFFYLPLFISIGSPFALEIARMVTALSKNATNLLSNAKVEPTSRGAFSIAGFVGLLVACALVCFAHYYFTIEIIECVICAVLIIICYVMYILFAQYVEERFAPISEQGEISSTSDNDSQAAIETTEPISEDVQVLPTETSEEIQPLTTETSEEVTPQEKSEMKKVSGFTGFNELSTNFCSVLVSTIIALIVGIIIS